MLRRILLPSVCGVLAYGFWVSPDFKEIAAGVAIFLFGMLSLEEGFRSFTGGVLEKIDLHSHRESVLERAQTAGKLRHIGITEVPPRDPAHAMLSRALDDERFQVTPMSASASSSNASRSKPAPRRSSSTPTWWPCTPTASTTG